MKSAFAKKAAVSVLMVSLWCPCALADYHHSQGHGYGHAYGHSKPHGHAYGHDYHHQKKIKHYTWNQERELYRAHWQQVSISHRKKYDAQMRAQWQAFHKNRWHGSSDWNNYQDPAFLDYLHNSNPSLLNSIRGLLGF